MSRRYVLCLVLPLLSLLYGGCSVFLTHPEYQSSQQRLAALPDGVTWPIENPVTIRWQENMIPFVQASSDDDCAFAIGVIHAHLRLGQLELMRRLSSGRLAQSGGPFVAPFIDQVIRTINLKRSAKLSLEKLTKQDRQWLKRFVDGINFYIEQSKDLPVEFAILNFEPEPWTELDAIQVGRIAAADINWGSYLSFLKLRQETGWENVWHTYLEQGRQSLTSFTPQEQLSLTGVLANFTRSGSNSVVVAGHRSNGPGALIANDPHLGIFAPNFWLLMGYQCPSYHVVGYMLPGVPAVTVGRNNDLAWGGTYMRAISSHVFAVKPEEVVDERQETIARRWWFDKTVTIRESKKGPIISDFEGYSQPGELLALNWAGHQASNELGAFLGANRAQNWSQFRAAFSDYAVAGLNLTYADKLGNIAMILAYRQPLLANASELHELIKSNDNHVIEYRSPLELPIIFNPSDGFIASANNMPIEMEPQLAFVAGQSDRIRRWKTLLNSKKIIDLADLKSWQVDVFSHDSYTFKKQLLSILPEAPPQFAAAWQALKGWNGEYRTDSEAAALFEKLTWQMATTLISQLDSSTALQKKLLDSEDWRTIFKAHFDKLIKDQQQQQILTALKSIDLNNYQTWGEMHVQRIQNPLGLLPIIGERFRYQDYGAAGASTTINKSAFAPGDGQRQVSFGAQSRHLSDLNDPDANYFVMLGGNDGWLNNQHLYDQVELWRQGKYVQLPLSAKGVKEMFSLSTIAITPESN